ncbi:hypothetical protein [Paeniglutamicibacter antarcticus]|uniref:Uncharacterized protein n=1 Tax=Paeniglutamicibacter antarcticus TaxID=494023 RepID=A0ABP9TUL3_9MICC
MAPVASNASVASQAAKQAPLRIFYDRLAVALLGCLSVLTLLIGAVLALAGVVSGAVPLIALLLALASFSALRGLAVRDRRKKLLARMHATRTRAMETLRTPVAEPAKRTAEVFDAQPNSNKRAPALTVHQLRAEALRIAEKGAAVTRPEGWELTEVPLPQYVVANAAKRQAPEPMQAAAEMKASTSASLRSQEAAARMASATGPAIESIAATPAATAEEKPAVKVPAAENAKPGAEAVAERINLDDVMQRRRA